MPIYFMVTSNLRRSLNDPVLAGSRACVVVTKLSNLWHIGISCRQRTWNCQLIDRLCKFQLLDHTDIDYSRGYSKWPINNIANTEGKETKILCSLRSTNQREFWYMNKYMEAWTYDLRFKHIFWKWNCMHFESNVVEIYSNVSCW